MSLLAESHRKARQAFLYGLSLVIVALSCRGVSAQQNSPPASPVTAAPILHGYVQSNQTFVGTVVPTKTAIVGSAVDGRVIELKVNEGDRVGAQKFPKKEDVAEDDSKVPACCRVEKDDEDNQPEGSTDNDPDSIIAQLLTATIELEIKAEQQECIALTQQYLKLKKGMREEEKEQARALMIVAREAAQFLDKEYQRILRLNQRGAVTERELQEAKYKMEQSKQTFIEREKAYELAVKGPREEEIAMAKARRDMQANVVEKLQDQMKKYTIRSKFDGYIVQEFTEAGAWVNRGDPIAEVAALDEVDVLVNVLESAIAYVVRGEKVKVNIPALAEESMRDGTVELIVPRADYKTRTFPVKIRLKNEIVKGVPLLKAGMLAKVSLPTSRSSLSYLVPKDSITLGETNPAIYVIDGAKKSGETGKPRKISVKTGIAVDTFIVIKPINPEVKLQQNSLVVTRGNERMQGVSTVKVEKINTDKPADGFKESKTNAAQVTQTDSEG